MPLAANAKIRTIRRLIDREMRNHAAAVYFDGLISREFGSPGSWALICGAKRMRRIMKRLGLTPAIVVAALSEIAQREAAHNGTELPLAYQQMSFLEFELTGEG